MTHSSDRDLIGGGIPNPRELMRARHPDLFSDTRVDDVPLLPRAVFEYHLDTLTSRKQEYEFEHFCRKLAEKEICPNLRVQTGPAGGGDSITGHKGLALGAGPALDLGFTPAGVGEGRVLFGVDDGRGRIELGSAARVATYVFVPTPFKVGRGADVQLAGT